MKTYKRIPISYKAKEIKRPELSEKTLKELKSAKFDLEYITKAIEESLHGLKIGDNYTAKIKLAQVLKILKG